ncbi:response regulator transcription factor [Mucilaginibacter pallidiroseus]|uniref:Response regulator transcription factor n=1 Tax=Mucilaginibacter pallidiroseus TaxID=2599295 RepID=A0A563U825_9SPHI|nr:response regulator transcription factor [Mucilaginibacter pallidiroseus]TWR27507.1 response regulator transcription factor [Mucilaginibacter pallidiroseus]
MKVLLVEDEPGLVSVIVRGLTEAGMDVSVAADGITGVEMTINHKFDVIILDVMLPGLNGIQVCKEVRKHDDSVAILMLTALDSTENIVTGLNAGADDYLAKPFKFAELEARIHTLVRRSRRAEANKNIVSIAGLEVDIASKTAKRNGRNIALTATEYRLLEYFVKHQNMILSRIQILENVWDIDFNMGTNVVDVYVNYLRKKIDSNGEARLIHTVFGMGYIFKDDSHEAAN